jgi:vancomycin resistance protein YoaR
VVLVVLLLIMIAAGYQFLHEDEIYPGISTVFDLNLAGMTRDEAKAALSERFSYDQDATFSFRYQDQIWEYTAGDLGVMLDVDATVDAAYNVGRKGSRVERLLKQLEIWRNGYPVAPVITYNQSQAESILSEIAGDSINRPVLDATLSIRDNKAITTPSQIGYAVDIPATLSALRREILALNTHSDITLVIKETPPLVWDTSGAAQQIDLALAAPVEFYLPTGSSSGLGPWSISSDDLQKMLVINETTNADGTAGYTVDLNLDDPRAFLTNLSPDLTTEPVDARFVFNDDTHQLDVIQKSVNGRVLDIETTVAQFKDAVFAQKPEDRRVKLVFQDLAPRVSDTATAQQLGITELVSKKTTYYYGSPPARRTNIEVAASRFHGLVIAPGEEFSFNKWLGDVSPESGYEQGLIIVGNQTITGVGGGVCQVATTAFQTAFYGGYPILERIEHAYRVGYYEEGEGPGMDATVYSPIVDFRFLNNTPYYLLIETYNNPGSSTLTWKFYSTSMNRRVVKEGPIVKNQTAPPPAIYRANASLAAGQILQVDYASSGSDVYVYRTVYENDKIVIDHEEFHSHYMPWANQYEVAPGDRRING